MRGWRCEAGSAEHGRVYAPRLFYKHVQLMQDAVQAAQQWQPYKSSCPASCLLSCGVQLEIDTYPWLRRKAVQVRCLGGCRWVRQQEGAAVSTVSEPVGFECVEPYRLTYSVNSHTFSRLRGGFCIGTIPEQPHPCLPHTIHNPDLHALGL